MSVKSEKIRKTDLEIWPELKNLKALRVIH